MNTQPNWKEVPITEIPDNPVDLIGNQWMLVTAGTLQRWNTMTAAWGCLGFLWRKPVAICFVRPTRFTFEFINQAPYYTLSFFAPEYKDLLDFCGSHSGRDTDKEKATGLIPVDIERKGVSFAQARMVWLCRKLYTQDLEPRLFLDSALEQLYPNKDYHRFYVGEVEKCLVKIT
ncbi:MAG: flavin reductase [Spirochaetales bacterium]